MASKYLYKIWYIATFITVIALVIYFLNKPLPYKQIIRNSTPLLLYFIFIPVTAIWAFYPEETLQYFLIDSIYFIVFISFFIISMELDINSYEKLFSNLAISGLIITIIYYLINPYDIRQTGFANQIMIFSASFSYLNLKIRTNKLSYFLFGLSVLIILFGNSRRPLLNVTITILLFELFNQRIRIIDFSKKILFIVVSISILIIILWQIPPTQNIMLTSVSRLLQSDIEIGGVFIKAEGKDLMREKINDYAWYLMKNEDLILGIGYMNFFRWFGLNTTSYEMVLHNVYQSWLLEMGIIGLFFSFLILYKYFSIILKKLKQIPKFSTEWQFFTLMLSIMVGLLVGGWYGQLHRNPIFFIALGIVYGMGLSNTNKISNIYK